MPRKKNNKQAERQKTKSPPRLVAIGSSAGGLEALRILIANLPANANFAYLIAQHVSPSHKSMLSELLARETKHLNIVDVRERLEPIAQTVYVTPPNFDLIVRKGFLELVEPTHKVGPKPCADHLFLSLAEDAGHEAIGVVLSGTGSDGAQGVRAIRAHGGITIAQDPDTAKFNGMPSAAIQIGNADLILATEQIGPYLAQYASDGVRPPHNEIGKASAIEELLALVEAKHGVDFTSYNQEKVSHQVSRRLHTLRVDTIDDYVELVRETPAEVDRLYQSFLRSVTSFFKDEQGWQRLQRELSEYVASMRVDTPIRVWVAGCASGEEAYSIAIVLNELLLELNSKQKVKIFATDLDEQSLEIARAGLYPEVYVDQQVVKPLRDRYFTRQGRSYRISKSIRDSIVFARHNLVGDPVFHSVDLICCRNVFADLLPELRQRLQHSFYKALLENGFLFLGESERIEDGDQFAAIDGGAGLYRRIGARSQLTVVPAIDPPAARRKLATRKMLKPVETDLAVEEAKAMMLRYYTPISVLIDDAFVCQHFFGDMRKLLTIGTGSANLNLPSLLPSDIKAPVRALLNRATKEKREVDLTIRRRESNVDLINLRAVVRPVMHVGQQADFYLASFEPLSTETTISVDTLVDEDQLRQANQRLKNELMSTQESLQAVIEEIETSNEELLALNEELQANSEELIASNEQLQTSN